MNKTMSAIVLATLLGAMPVAYAQAPHSTTAPSQSTTAYRAEQTIQPNQIRPSKMIGRTVYDTQNRDIGKIKDVILDRQGRVDLVVLDVGTFLGVGRKSVAVPLSDLKTDNNRLTLDRSKEQLGLMSAFRPDRDRTTPGR
jgi:sporulation protein YlmC with PRC-barrel domain